MSKRYWGFLDWHAVELLPNRSLVLFYAPIYDEILIIHIYIYIYHRLRELILKVRKLKLRHAMSVCIIEWQTKA